MFNIHLLPASFGDAILIEYGKRKRRYVWIDGGPYNAYEEVMRMAAEVAPGLKTLELLVITHVDIDHIDGTITMLNKPLPDLNIKEIWFNGYKELEMVKDDTLGMIQGEFLSLLIKKSGIPHNKAFDGGPVMVHDPGNLPVVSLPGGLKLTLLAPDAEALLSLKPKWAAEIAGLGSEKELMERLQKDHRYDTELPDDLLGGGNPESWQKAPEKEDKTPVNGSSIALLAEYAGKSVLLSGDCPSWQLLKTMAPLAENTPEGKVRVDAWKLAHHGSKKSTVSSIMQVVESPRILFSSDGKRYHHPDPECAAKLLKYLPKPLTFYFNYRSDYNKIWENESWKKKYGYDTQFSSRPQGGITISLA